MIGRVIRVTGPGLMLAGMAIGISHLVQATRAGAGFGWQLAGLVIAVHVAKYPFFEYGHRYAAVTGESLLHGYLRLGRGLIVAFILIHVVIAVVGTAAIVYVTVALAGNIFRVGTNPSLWGALLLAAGITVAAIGRFRGLDIVNRSMIFALVVATTVALVAAFAHGPVAPKSFEGPNPWQVAHVGFLIALMGGMPGPISVSIYQSLWVVARDRASGRRISLRDALFDFNLGYGLTAVMALVFLGLGAITMYGSGEQFAASSIGFASQFIILYEQTLGEWVRPVIAVVALLAMLTTTLSSIDAAPRALAMAQTLLQVRRQGTADDGTAAVLDRRLHSIWMIGVGLAALVIVHAFSHRFTELIDLAMTLSFLVAPVFAFFNMRVIASRHMPEQTRPGPVIRGLSILGLAFLFGFGLLYMMVRLEILGS